MTEFEKKLIRLKEQLGVTQDKEIAALLGMEPRAFTARKARGSFPDDKVRGLLASHPNLDISYILNGDIRQWALDKIQRDIASLAEPRGEYATLGRSEKIKVGFEQLSELDKQFVESMIARLLDAKKEMEN